MGAHTQGSASPDPADAVDQEGSSGLSRRGIIKGAAGIGAAGLVLGSLSGTAQAAPLEPAAAPAGQVDASHDLPVVAHLADARSGAVDLFVGEQHNRVHNPALADALAKAATNH